MPNKYTCRFQPVHQDDVVTVSKATERSSRIRVVVRVLSVDIQSSLNHGCHNHFCVMGSTEPRLLCMQQPVGLKKAAKRGGNVFLKDSGHHGRREMGRKFFKSLVSAPSFFKRGITVALLKSTGTTLQSGRRSKPPLAGDQ